MAKPRITLLPSLSQTLTSSRYPARLAARESRWTMARQLATREYIEIAAMRYDTPVAAAFRRSLGITAKPKRRRRRRRHSASHKPTRKELDECRKQKHGVVWHEQ